jgi:hypothetical protein
MNRDPVRNTDPMTPPVDAALPGVARLPQDSSTVRTDGPMDPKTASILKALDRPPRPPAPTPDLRASSEGGDFVAYSAVAQPASGAARSLEERRQQALVQLAVLVQEPESPVAVLRSPSRDASTQIAAHRLRHRLWQWAAASLGGGLVAIAVMAWRSSAATTAPPQAPPTATMTDIETTPPVGSGASHRMAPMDPLPLTSAPQRAPSPTTTTTTLRPSPRAATPIAPAGRPAPQPTAASGNSIPDRLIEHPW